MVRIARCLVALSAFAGVISAATSGSLPTCAQTCVAEGISAAGCSLTDVACFCSATSFLETIAACLLKVCDTADQEASLEYAQSLCASSGVTLSNPEALLTELAAGATSSAIASTTSDESSASTTEASTIASSTLAPSSSTVAPSKTSSAPSTTSAVISTAIPSCAVVCIEDYIASTTCTSSDIECFCSDSAFLSDIASCLTNGCTAEEQETICLSLLLFSLPPIRSSKAEESLIEVLGHFIVFTYDSWSLFW
ncbi:hypothetical protein V1511DRAFT_59000 [Dipodascopsis uninucleata]